MREIKFRAWDERKKVMHYDFQFIKSGDSGNDWIIFTSNIQRLDKNDLHPFDNPYFSQQFKIMEWTGLKDKYGSEIYEDDIVHYWDHEGGDGKGHVKFENGSWIVRKTSKHYWIGLNSPDLNQVMGNKYENPKLLEAD